MKEKPQYKESENSEATSKKNSVKTFLLFCGVVFLIIVVSLVYRGFRLWQHSSFDGVSGYSVMYVQNDGKKAAVYTFDPEERHVSRVIFSASRMLPNLSDALGIPVDGEIWVSSVTDDENFPLSLHTYSLYNQVHQKDISIIDMMRMWYLYGSYPASKKPTETIKLPEELATYESKIDEYFIDSRLEKDKKTISIKNGTSVSGLGVKMEQLISKTGANVISITTSHDLIPQTKIIYYGEKNYTVERLERLLNYPVEQQSGPSLSDILIEIGEDATKTNRN